MLVQGPWPELPPIWYCSINGGASAFSVFGQTRKEAVAKAACAIYDEVFESVDPDDPFACDTAQSAYDVLLERLYVYEPKEWDAKCWADYEADKLAKAPHRVYAPTPSPVLGEAS